MLVREFFPGTVGQPNAQYIMLQMYTSGQHFVMNHFVRVYDSTGATVATYTFPAHLTGPSQNQDTILLATTEAVTLFGISADLSMGTGGAPIAPAGGKICFDGHPDCVSWGSFSGPLTLSPTGTPYNACIGLTLGQAVRRKISGGSSPTELDAGDDTNDSEADFDCSDAEPKNYSDASAFLAASPACPALTCGNNAVEVCEECDGTDDTACPGLCETDCTCPAPPQALLGKLLLVKDPLPGGGGDPTKRKFIVKAKEAASPNTVEGNPLANPSTLEVDLAGTTPTSQIFSLPSGQAWWKVIGGGFKYKDSAAANGPVKTLIIKKSGSGTFLLKAVGKASISPINLVPPNTGTSADVSFSIGTTRYCTSFGGAAGGDLDPNDDRTFKAKNATAEVACPP